VSDCAIWIAKSGLSRASRNGTSSTDPTAPITFQIVASASPLRESRKTQAVTTSASTNAMSTPYWYQATSTWLAPIASCTASGRVVSMSHPPPRDVARLRLLEGQHCVADADAVAVIQQHAAID